MSRSYRKLLSTFALMSVLLALVLGVQRYILPTPTAAAAFGEKYFEFEQLHMLDATDGWALVFAYKGTPTINRFILHTQNGGKTWTNVTLPGYNAAAVDILPSAVQFLDDQHAWFIYKGTAWRTADAGQTWPSNTLGLDYETIHSGPSVGFLLDFIDALHGWLLVQQCCAMPEALYQTKDGGASWTRVSDYAVPGGMGNLPGDYHADMTFQTQTEGWIFPSGASGPGAAVAVTHDGGKTWTGVQLPVLPDRTASGDQHRFYCDLGSPAAFSGSSTFIVICSYIADSSTTPDKLFIYHTADDGTTWQSSPPLTNVNTTTLDFVTPTLAWVVIGDPKNANGGLLMRTLDGGQTWIQMGVLPDALAPSAVSGYAPIFDFIDENTGWAIDSSGSLQYTADAGKTWTALAVGRSS